MELSGEKRNVKIEDSTTDTSKEIKEDNELSDIKTEDQNNNIIQKHELTAVKNKEKSDDQSKNSETENVEQQELHKEREPQNDKQILQPHVESQDNATERPNKNQININQSNPAEPGKFQTDQIDVEKQIMDSSGEIIEKNEEDVHVADNKMEGDKIVDQENGAERESKDIIDVQKEQDGNVGYQNNATIGDEKLENVNQTKIVDQEISQINDLIDIKNEDQKEIVTQQQDISIKDQLTIKNEDKEEKDDYKTSQSNHLTDVKNEDQEENDDYKTSQSNQLTDVKNEDQEEKDDYKTSQSNQLTAVKNVDQKERTENEDQEIGIFKMESEKDTESFDMIGKDEKIDIMKELDDPIDEVDMLLNTDQLVDSTTDTVEALKYGTEFFSRQMQEKEETNNQLDHKLKEKQQSLEEAERKIKDLQIRLIRHARDDEAKDRYVASLESEIKEINKQLEEIIKEQQMNREKLPNMNAHPTTAKPETRKNEASKTCTIL